MVGDRTSKFFSQLYLGRDVKETKPPLPLMEPDVKKYLTVIMQCMSMTLLWMVLQTYFGIKLGLLFLDGELTIWHGVYYLLMLGSLAWLIHYIWRKFKTIPAFDLDRP